MHLFRSLITGLVICASIHTAQPMGLVLKALDNATGSVKNRIQQARDFKNRSCACIRDTVDNACQCVRTTADKVFIDTRKCLCTYVHEICTHPIDFTYGVACDACNYSIDYAYMAPDILRELVAHQRVTGALSPSTPRLARRITAPTKTHREGTQSLTFLEAGCGVGSVSRVLINEIMRDGDTLHAVDINKKYINRTSRLFPHAKHENVTWQTVALGIP